MWAAHLRHGTVGRPSDPVPGLRHDPHRAPGVSRACRAIDPATASVLRPQAFGRGDSGHAFNCAGYHPHQTTHIPPTQESEPAAEICGLCHRVSRLGWGRLPLRAILAEQAAGQREFQTDPGQSRTQWRRGWPHGRSERCNGHVGRYGGWPLIKAAPCNGPTASGRPSTNNPRRQPCGKSHERRHADEVPAAWANRPRQRRASIDQLSNVHIHIPP